MLIYDEAFPPIFTPPPTEPYHADAAADAAMMPPAAMPRRRRYATLVIADSYFSFSPFSFIFIMVISMLLRYVIL
jgi:hypothetical protein